MSSLGKGIAGAAIGSLLKARGYKLRMRKLDPYLNVDPGTMSPYQHGEVYVTNDGAETDLDLGHYERFIGIHPCCSDSVSGGKVYWDVLNKERKGDYLGGTVQMIPHVSDRLKYYISNDVTDEDFVICELGGTVGDIEGLIFLESIRQFANDVGRKNVMFIHLTLVPYIATAQELKTKPTQHSVKSLLEKGIQADMLLCRSPMAINDSERKKLALFCNMEAEDVITALDMDNIYKIPLYYEQQHVAERILSHFNMAEGRHKPDLSKWEELHKYLDVEHDEVQIAVVGKYFAVADAYKSLNEALFHAGVANNVRVKIKQVAAEDLETKTDKEIAEVFSDVKGILVPGGFGERGIAGKMAAIRYARENKVPYFGICLGMQLAVIEFARNVLNIKNAHSTEFTKDCTAVISLMSEWEHNGVKETRTEDSDKGGSLRLGAYPCTIAKDTLAYKVYGAEKISERHRHRYEMDMSYEQILADRGMIISGRSPDGKLPEIVELRDHPFFIAGQFHPEFQSNPFTPHPIFKGFVLAALST